MADPFVPSLLHRPASGGRRLRHEAEGQVRSGAEGTGGGCGTMRPCSEADAMLRAPRSARTAGTPAPRPVPVPVQDLPFDPVELRATDPARNIRRRWRMVVTRDLFGRLVVETGWGRVGARERVLCRSFASEADALRYCRALLARRAGAERRIGVGYVAA